MTETRTTGRPSIIPEPAGLTVVPPTLTVPRDEPTGPVKTTSVWITPSSHRTAAAAERAGLVRTIDLPVDLGGVRGHLERWERRA